MVERIPPPDAKLFCGREIQLGEVYYTYDYVGIEKRWDFSIWDDPMNQQEIEDKHGLCGVIDTENTMSNMCLACAVRGGFIW